VLASCGSRLKWSEARSGTVAGLTVAVFMGAAAEAQLDEAGVSAKAIDSWFEGQEEAVQTRMEIADADMERLGAALLKAGISEEKLAANAEPVGMYLGTLIVFKRAERGLSIH